MLMVMRTKAGVIVNLDLQNLRFGVCKKGSLVLTMCSLKHFKHSYCASKNFTGLLKVLFQKQYF